MSHQSPTTWNSICFLISSLAVTPSLVVHCLLGPLRARVLNLLPAVVFRGHYGGRNSLRTTSTPWSMPMPRISITVTVYDSTVSRGGQVFFTQVFIYLVRLYVPCTWLRLAWGQA